MKHDCFTVEHKIKRVGVWAIKIWHVSLDTVDSITPDKVRGLRDLLNSSAMDIMYYNSPLYRDEVRIIQAQILKSFSGSLQSSLN